VCGGGERRIGECVREDRGSGDERLFCSIEVMIVGLASFYATYLVASRPNYVLGRHTIRQKLLQLLLR
jgi:hypothetical protein